MLTVYSKTDADGGQYRSLIHFDAPARDINKLLLKSGSDLWFYDPSSQASVRISPQLKHCYKLALTALSPEATYHSIDL